VTADEIIEHLQLRRHPEGGWYAETWRAPVDPNAPRLRAAGSAIYYLLHGHEQSRWHRVDAGEIWHWYAGDPLQLSLYDQSGPAGAPPPEARIEHLRLGPDLRAGEAPQRLVPPGRWQRATCLGAFTLVGCTVSPAFEFERFEMAPASWG
jgi:predicted cupin superfamily sugar epimerase